MHLGILIIIYWVIGVSVEWLMYIKIYEYDVDTLFPFNMSIFHSTNSLGIKWYVERFNYAHIKWMLMKCGGKRVEFQDLKLYMQFSIEK
jgi:hypothetical protein